jgi:UDP-N-acetylglucosamine 2-epimerase (non-hydrolysing)
MKVRKVFIIVGARPNFMKAAPLLTALKKYPQFKVLLVHTGQHYDKEMSDLFFRELRLPPPDIYLNVGSGSHGSQTAKIMMRFEKACLKERPHLIIVVGDVNSTAACALVAAKLFIPVAHVEAGLRSFDRSMPEEINRVMTDHLSDYLFTTCKDGNQNLRREGIPNNRIFFVGNVMIDTLMRYALVARKSEVLEKLLLKKNGKLRRYAVLTLHRPSNVDDPYILRGVLQSLCDVARTLPIIFPVHPRTMQKMTSLRIDHLVHYIHHLPPGNRSGIYTKILVLPPFGYCDFLRLMSQAALVFTDSGGIQEETTILGVPCLTLRNTTERPVTVREGTNVVVGNDPDRIIRAASNLLKNRTIRKKIPKFWDGKAAERIVNILTKECF